LAGGLPAVQPWGCAYQNALSAHSSLKRKERPPEHLNRGFLAFPTFEKESSIIEPQSKRVDRGDIH
jgi:hypothetical protein